MFDDDADGGKWIPSDTYYGEVVFNIAYKAKRKPFDCILITTRSKMRQ
jgi:hypothetical protein